MIDPYPYEDSPATFDTLSITPLAPQRREGVATFGQMLGASLRQANDLYNLWDLAQRPQFEVDLNFDAVEAAKESPLWDSHWGDLVRARSPEELSFIQSRITKRQEDLSILASRGWQGFVSAGAMGLMSPTTLIPFVGAARGARGAAQTVALAAAASSLQEAPIAFNQLGDTNSEIAFNVAAGTVIGSLLGGTAVYLRDRSLARLEAGLAGADEGGAIARMDENGRMVVEGEWDELNGGLEVFSGNLRLLHGFLDDAAPTFRNDFEGDRYGDSVFGDANVVYLDGDGKWMGGRVSGMSFENFVEVEANFKNALVVTPENMAAMISQARRGEGKFTLKEFADWARKLGHDGIIVTGFDDALARRAGYNEYVDDYNSEGANRAGEEWRKISDELGLEDAPQDQVISFNPEALKVLSDPRPARVWNEDMTKKVKGDIPPVSVKEAIAGKTQQKVTSQTGKSRGIGARARDARYSPVDDLGRPTDPGSAGNIAPVGPRGLGNVLGKVHGGLDPIRQTGMPKGVVAHTTRDLFQRMSDFGLRMEGNAQGIPTAQGGTAEMMKSYYMGLLANSYRALNEAYLEYLAAGAKVTAGTKLKAAKSRLTGRGVGGKISFSEFQKKALYALTSPKEVDVPEAVKLAGWWRENFFGKFNERMTDVTDAQGASVLYKIRPEEVDEFGEIIEGYGPHYYSPEKIVLKHGEFVKDVAEHYMRVMSEHLTNRIGRLLERKRAAGEMVNLMSLSRDQAAAELARLEAALAKQPDPADLDPRVHEIRLLRDEAHRLEEEEFERLMDWKAQAGRDINDPETQKAAKKEAKKTVSEQVKELRDRANTLEEELPAPVKQSKEQRARIRQQIKTIRSSFGAFEEKRAAILARIAENEETNLRSFSRIVSGHRRFLKEMDSFSDKKLDAEIVRLARWLEREVKLEARLKKKLEKIRPLGDEEEIASFEARIEASQQTQDLVDLFRNTRQSLDREAIRKAIRGDLDAKLRRINTINNARAQRNQTLVEKAAKYEPENVRAQIEKLTREVDEALDYMNSELGRLTENEGTVAGFTPEMLRDVATTFAENLYDKITNNYVRVGLLDLMPELRGPMKKRVLNLPYQVKQKYLETDAQMVLARYANTMGADIELFRAYGSTDGSTALQLIREEFRTLRERIEVEDVGQSTKEKRLAQLQQRETEYLATMAALLERYRGLRGLVSQRSGFGARLGKIALHWNVASMMGMATVSSFSDPARAISAYGLNRVYKNAWAPMIRGLVDESTRAENKKVLNYLRYINIGVDSLSGARSRGLFDLMAPDPFTTRTERFFEKASAMTPFVALFGPWTDANKLLTGMVSIARMDEALSDLAAGKASQETIAWLASNSIDSVMAGRIWASMNDPGGSEIVRGVRLPNSMDWSDRAAARLYEAALNRESDRLVISPGMEKSLWTDSNMGARLIAQFRSFMLASNSKTLMAGLQARDKAAVWHETSGFLSSLALGAVSYYTWAMVSGEAARKEMREADWRTWVDQALMRGGYMGALSEIQNIGSAIPLTAPYVTFGGGQLAGRRADNLMGAMLGPTFGKAWDISMLLQGIDEPTEGTVNQARKLVFWQNHFALKSALEAVEQGVNNLFNLPERRGQ